MSTHGWRPCPAPLSSRYRSASTCSATACAAPWTSGTDAMSETSPSVELLEPIEDRGGAAQPLLQVTGLTKHFPVRGDFFSARKTVRAVDDVSFTVMKGETVGIVGESGCGKSTTARLLMHLMKRDAGDIVYDGMQVGRTLSLRELRR